MIHEEKFACGVLLGLSAVIGYLFGDVSGAALGVLTFFYAHIMCKLISDLIWPKHFVRQSDMGGFVIPDRRTITIRKSEFQIEIERTEEIVAEIREEIRLRRKKNLEQSCSWDSF